jgi:hypothetical protein
MHLDSRVLSIAQTHFDQIVVLSVNQRKWMFDSWSMHDYEQNLTLDYMKTCLVGWSFSVRFGFYKKKGNQTDFFSKNEPKPVQTDRFRFGSIIWEQKLVFFVWLGFFPVWLGFFDFRFIKLKPNWTGWFFKNSNRFNQFFFTVQFFPLFFFLVFSV